MTLFVPLAFLRVKIAGENYCSILADYSCRLCFLENVFCLILLGPLCSNMVKMILMMIYNITRGVLIQLISTSWSLCGIFREKCPCSVSCLFVNLTSNASCNEGKGYPNTLIIKKLLSLTGVLITKPNTKYLALYYLVHIYRRIFYTP